LKEEMIIRLLRRSETILDAVKRSTALLEN